MTLTELLWMDPTDGLPGALAGAAWGGLGAQNSRPELRL